MALAPKIKSIYWLLFSTIILVSISITKGHSQAVKPNVINTAGFMKNVADGFISISIGEFAVKTLEGTSLIITQGFLQPETELPCSNFELDYFPNPVTDFITIRDAECGLPIHDVEVIDLFGKSLFRTTLTNRRADFRSLGVGIFIIRAFSESGSILGTFKIVKITD